MNSQKLRHVGARASLVLTALALPMLARADAFSDAVTAQTTAIGTFGAALVGLAAVGVGFGIAIKYVKRIRGAA